MSVVVVDKAALQLSILSSIFRNLQEECLLYMGKYFETTPTLTVGLPVTFEDEGSPSIVVGVVAHCFQKD